MAAVRNFVAAASKNRMTDIQVETTNAVQWSRLHVSSIDFDIETTTELCGGYYKCNAWPAGICAARFIRL